VRALIFTCACEEGNRGDDDNNGCESIRDAAGCERLAVALLCCALLAAGRTQPRARAHLLLPWRPARKLKSRKKCGGSGDDSGSLAN